MSPRFAGGWMASPWQSSWLPGGFRPWAFRALADSLEDCFSVLTRGRRTALARHQTLRATLDWGYRLLVPEDQVALRCLSIFSGSFTLEDAAYVMRHSIGSGEANDRLASLLDKSMIVANPEKPAFRYRLLDTTRTYGRDKLEENGRVGSCDGVTPKRYRICRDSTASEESDWSLRQAAADIRAALEWSLGHGEDLSLGFDLASAATPVCLRLSLLREHKKYLDLALGHISSGTNPASDSEAALRSEMALRTAAAQADYYTEGLELGPEKQLQKAREIAGHLGDKTHELRTLWMLFGQAANVGSHRQALKYVQLYVAATRASTDPVGEFHCNRMLARVLSDLGQQSLALQHIELALLRSPAVMPRAALHAYEIDHWIAARAIYARTLWLRGYPDKAKTAAEQCMAEALLVGHEQSTCWAIAFNILPDRHLARRLQSGSEPC